MTPYWEVYLNCVGWMYPNDAVFTDLNFQVLGVFLIIFLLMVRRPKMDWRANYAVDENNA